MWGTLIALLHDGQPVLGVIDQPIAKERWVGVAGKPSTLNGAVIQIFTFTGSRRHALHPTLPLWMRECANCGQIECC